MVTLGTDSLKATHTFVAADEAGRQLGQSTFGANGDGHLKALKWAGQWSERRWALEDCRHLSRRLGSAGLRAGADSADIRVCLEHGIEEIGALGFHRHFLASYSWAVVADDLAPQMTDALKDQT